MDYVRMSTLTTVIFHGNYMFGKTTQVMDTCNFF